ncbi:MAG: DNA polymerase III subunit delta' [Candidatus Liberibacter europaeus]|uniref:DNA polymerase III subunit delta n=1 Tax=Candidatus Liberibacter europaeus TaxID=744859 RepID=A0A2T4VW71_9HYPH|nr:DNA polymerase III subunit delta' [Candidatus Liberibacter europaeus]PTL86028.1 MAG: DNA polymerase III subunit delta' [Candidatus Liberibacter europaeus]
MTSTIINGGLGSIYNQKLFGHEQIEEFLSQYYCSGKMHHALIFQGAEGIGKATLGLRYACHIFQNPEFRYAPSKIYPPDINSPIVRQMASLSLHDFLYLSYQVDNKTGKLRTVITVDEIRRIRNFLSLTANNGGWRIVMIDPADGMNRNASNALLKSLEDPPKKVLFILISHVSGMILPTIRSRCLSIKFKTLSENNICKAIENLGIKLSQEKRSILINASNGSVTRAIKILNYGCDKIISAYADLMRIRNKNHTRQMMQQIADELANNDKYVVFNFFTEFILEDTYKRAKEAALLGQLEEADQIVEIYHSIKNRIDSFFIYHLDRQQTILYLLEKAIDCCNIYCRDFYDN